MINSENVTKAMEILWSYCEKCKYHDNEKGCKRKQGVCEIDEAWNYLDASIDDDDKEIN